MSDNWIDSRERGAPELHIYVSECCKAPLVKLEREVVKKTSPGVTSYYQQNCSKCNQPSHAYKSKIFDSAGVLIEPVDIVECPTMPLNHSCRWHAAHWCDSRGGIDIRDLGCNNCGMYSIEAPYYTRGPYWLHLDKLSDEDLLHYWDTTREEALKRNLK